MGAVTRLRDAPVRVELLASLAATTADSVLYNAIADAELQLAGIKKTLLERLALELPAANNLVLAGIRNIADALRAAPHEYETAEREDRE